MAKKKKNKKSIRSNKESQHVIASEKAEYSANSNEAGRNKSVSEGEGAQPTSLDGAKKKKGWLGHFELKVDTEDKWELWSILAIILFVITAILLVISFLQLGKWSVFAWIEGLLYCGFATIVIGFLGMLRVLFRPPPIRRTRTIAFVLLLLVGIVGLAQPRPFGIPLSTDDWKQDATIELPFNGTWTTIQGNDDNNYLKHMKIPPLQWSYVFTAQVDKHISRPSKGVPRNEDYYCWDKPVLAPVSGEVVDFSTSNPDLGADQSTQQNQTSPLGNFVAIKFGPKEFLYVSGLKAKSITVKPGDKVKIGEEIGRCGRSGYALFPSVSIHAQNSLNFPFSEGLPIYFDHIKINNELSKKGRPTGTRFEPDLQVSEGSLVENSVN